MFSSDRDLVEVLEEVGRLGVRLLMQTAVEAEVGEFLGRDRYSSGEREREGSRNGYGVSTVKTTAGPVEVASPSCGEPPNRSSPGCSARASPGPTPWSRW